MIKAEHLKDVVTECGIMAALEVVGERWSFLILRGEGFECVRDDGAQGVEEMRLTFLAKALERGFYLLRIIRPVSDNLRLLVISDDEQLVAFKNLIGKLARGLFQLIHIRTHGERIIHEQDDARGRRVWRETLYDLLCPAVVERDLFGRNWTSGIFFAFDDDVEQDRATVGRTPAPAGLPGGNQGKSKKAKGKSDEKQALIKKRFPPHLYLFAFTFCLLYLYCHDV